MEIESACKMPFDKHIRVNFREICLFLCHAMFDMDNGILYESGYEEFLAFKIGLGAVNQKTSFSLQKMFGF